MKFTEKMIGASVLALVALAFPAANALATPEDPTQAAAQAATAAKDAAEAAADAADAAADAAAVAASAAGGSALTEAQMEDGRTLFNDWSCGACHVLGDAGGNGHIGPSLDGNEALDHDFVVSRVTNGQGAMPGFGGQMSDEEIDLLATYIVAAKK